MACNGTAEPNQPCGAACKVCVVTATFPILITLAALCLQIGHLQDALQELRDSIKVSMKDASSQRQQYEADAETRAQADKAVHQVRHDVRLSTAGCPWQHPQCTYSVHAMITYKLSSRAAGGCDFCFCQQKIGWNTEFSAAHSAAASNQLAVPGTC